MSGIWNLRTDYVLNEARARRRRVCWIQLLLALSALAAVVYMLVR